MKQPRFRRQLIQVSLQHPTYQKEEVSCGARVMVVEANGVQLAVHRKLRAAINADDEVVAIQAFVPEYEAHKAWDVTHVASGKSLGMRVPSETKARQVALATLHDKILLSVFKGANEIMIHRRARLSGLDKVKTRMDVIRKTVLAGRAHELPGMASGGEE